MFPSSNCQFQGLYILIGLYESILYGIGSAKSRNINSSLGPQAASGSLSNEESYLSEAPGSGLIVYFSLR